MEGDCGACAFVNQLWAWFLLIAKKNPIHQLPTLQLVYNCSSGLVNLPLNSDLPLQTSKSTPVNLFAFASKRKERKCQCLLFKFCSHICLGHSMRIRPISLFWLRSWLLASLASNLSLNRYTFQICQTLDCFDCCKQSLKRL